jgi:hypothetical protein
VKRSSRPAWPEAGLVYLNVRDVGLGLAKGVRWLADYHKKLGLAVPVPSATT